MTACDCVSGCRAVTESKRWWRKPIDKKWVLVYDGISPVFDRRLVSSMFFQLLIETFKAIERQ